MPRLTVAQLAAAIETTRRELRNERARLRLTQRALKRGWRTPDQIASSIDRAKELVYRITLTRRRIERRWRVH